MIKLNDKQIDRLSQACTELAVVIMGLTVLPYMLGATVSTSALKGSLISTFLYLTSLLLLNSTKWTQDT